MKNIFLFPLLCYVLIVCDSASPPNGVKKASKLCGNVDCSEVLFRTKIVRKYESAHDDFLAYSEGENVLVKALKFSDRHDIMEGTIGDRSGILFSNHMDKGPLVEFLRDAIDRKKEMIAISRDERDRGDKRIVGYVHAEQELVRDYNVQAKIYALEQKLPPPEELPVPEVPSKGHGHSHDHGHGHSHGGHSHGGHGHSHGVAETVAVAAPTPITKDSVDSAVPVGLAGKTAADSQATASDEANSVVADSPSIETTDLPLEAPVAIPIIEDSAVLPVLDKLDPVRMDQEIEEAIKRESMLAEKMAAGKNAASVPVQEPIVEEESSKKGLSTGDIIGSTIPIPVAAATPQQNLDVNEDVPVAVTATEAPTPTHVPIRDEMPTPVVNIEQIVATTPVPLSVDAPDAATTAAPDAVNETPTPMEVPTTFSAEAPSSTTMEPTKETAAQEEVPQVALPPLSTSGDVKLPPLYAEFPTTTIAPHLHQYQAPSTTPSPPVPVPEDPQPTVAEQGFCDGDDCGRLVSSSGANSALPSPVFEAVGDVAQTVTDTTQPPSPAPADPLMDITTPAPSLDPLRPETAFEDNLNLNMAAGSDFVDMEALNRRNAPTTGGSGVLGGIISSIVGVVRSILPLGDMSDAGVGLVLNLLFVGTALLIHIISLVISDNGDSVHFDHRVSHDLATKCKGLQEQLKQRDEEVKKLSATAGRSQADADEIANLRLQLGPLQLEVQQLRNRVAQSESDVSRERAEREALEAARDQLRDQTSNAEKRAGDAQVELECAKKQVEETRKELSATKNALDRYEADLANERRRCEQLNAKLDDAKSTIIHLESEIEKGTLELRALSESKRQLEMINSEATAMLEEYERKKETERDEGADKDAAESGGSGGWSDFGDEPEDDTAKAEKTPPASTMMTSSLATGGGADMKELIKERALRKKIEQDYESTKLAMERATEDVKRLEASLSSKQIEVDRWTKEVEQRDARSQASDANMNELVSILKKTSAQNQDKLNEAEMECKKLREEIARWQSDMAAVQEEKRKKEDRIKDLDSKVKDLSNNLTKLETKSFHDLMEMKKRLDAAQLSQVLTPAAPSGFDSSRLMNLSGSSLDRDNAPSRGAVQFEMPSLWDEGPSVTTGRQSGMRSSRILSDEEFLPGGAMPVVKKSSRSRRDKLVAREPSPSDGEKKKEKKETGVVPRRRSRSHGRQPYMGPMPPYIPGGPGYPPMYHHDPMSFGGELDRRLSKSGHLHYSSGGSNGGRSPPPMPLISALPPPGTRRPSTKRATGEYVQQPPTDYH